MHIQARASTKTLGFADAGDDAGNVAISATYGPGVLSDMLRILSDNGFNLRTASGRQIELGGEFAFWVDPRKDVDEDHDVATRRAAKALEAKGYDAHIVEVHRKLLDDVPGALKAFVDEVTAAGYLIEELSVGTPQQDGIPVQAYTAKTSGSPSGS